MKLLGDIYKKMFTEKKDGLESLDMNAQSAATETVTQKKRIIRREHKEFMTERSEIDEQEVVRPLQELRRDLDLFELQAQNVFSNSW